MTSPARYLDLISRTGGATALENTGGGASDAAVKQDLLDRLRAEIEYVQQKTGVQVDPGDLSKLVAQADEGLSRLFGDGPDAQLGPAEVSGLEAVIRTDGSRPALFVEDDFVDVTAPSVGGYAAPLSRLEEAVRQVCRSVGRSTIPHPVRIRSAIRARRGCWPKGWW